MPLVAEGNAKCKVCKQEFANTSRLNRHVRNYHGGKNRNPNTKWMIVLGVALAGAAIAMAVSDDGPPTNPTDLRTHFGVADDPHIGNLSAPITIVAFESPHCSACQGMHVQVLPKLREQYLDTGDAVLFYAHHTWGHEQDIVTSMSQECVYQQGGNDAFWGYADLIYSKPSVYGQFDTQQDLQMIANRYNLDGEQLWSCVEGRDTSRTVRDDWDAARDNGATGTPTIFVFGPSGQVINAPASNLLNIVSDQVYLAQRESA